MCESSSQNLKYGGHYSCTRNGDHLPQLVKTGNTHKQRVIFQTAFRFFQDMKVGGNIVKNDGGTKMLIVFTITEITIFSSNNVY